MPRGGGRSHTPPPAPPAPPPAAAAAAPSSRHPAKEGRILRPLVPLNKAVAVAVERAPSAVGAAAHTRTSGGGLANANTSGAPAQQERAPSAAAQQHVTHTTQGGGASVRGEHSVSVGAETTATAATAASGGGGGGGASTGSTAAVPHATPTVKELFEQRAEARTAAAAAQFSALTAAAAERSPLTANIASADSNSLHASTTTPHPPETQLSLASGPKTRPGQTMHIVRERDRETARGTETQRETERDTQT